MELNHLDFPPLLSLDVNGEEGELKACQEEGECTPGKFSVDCEVELLKGIAGNPMMRDKRDGPESDFQMHVDDEINVDSPLDDKEDMAALAGEFKSGEDFCKRSSEGHLLWSCKLIGSTTLDAKVHACLFYISPIRDSDEVYGCCSKEAMDEEVFHLKSALVTPAPSEVASASGLHVHSPSLVELHLQDLSFTASKQDEPVPIMLPIEGINLNESAIEKDFILVMEMSRDMEGWVSSEADTTLLKVSRPALLPLSNSFCCTKRDNVGGGNIASQESQSYA
ncbi:hypothetical protein NE237_033312 [Protea cynaroides]|uniref:Uncharacterized protein n=1 Tax=Protea cynaroides TaxID=273540 RepID=A0A9Q0L5G9_9MAGN|nr:hypothetical protein NE237_033312 [Protea cynaroides]